MKVIFIAPKLNIPDKLINKLKKLAKVYFFEDDPIDIRNIKLLKEKGEKILCPFPEPMAWQFPNDFISQIPDLEAICLSTTSFSWVDGNLCRKHGIPLTHVPNPPNGVAEGAIFMMLGVARRFAVLYKEKKFKYEPQNFLSELKGKTMGIVGLGKIGLRIAEIGEGLGMEIVYYSRSKKQTKYKYLALEKLLMAADFIFSCLAKNEETKNFFSKEKIDLLKPSAVLVDPNTGVVDLDYLVKKVEKEELFGAAFESDEKKTGDFKGNIFVVPHCNWYTKETVEKKMELWFKSITSIIKGKPINVAN